jgi:UDP-N-acetylmuramoylalanine--D-glutamate ligase
MTLTSDKILSGKKITVLGAARSGVAVASLLKKKGAKVFISDSAPIEKLKSQILDIQSLGIEFETGGHTDRVLDAEIIVVSPGVPSNIPIIYEAEQKSIKIISEVELASQFCLSPMIAVTGTNGKTTTTTLIGELMKNAKVKHIVAGNIGTAFSSFIETLDSQTVAVLEVSSFQLDHCETFHPRVSIILNITPDHLDRYDQNFEKYIASKCRVFEHQTKTDYLIYNYDNEETREQVRRLASLHVRILAFGVNHQFNEGAFVENGKLVTIVGDKHTEIIETGKIGIRGIHNLYNSMAATLAAQVMGLDLLSVRETLKQFKGVEHRLEFVRELNGIKYINDSKATNVDSVWYALQAFEEPLIVLIGGRDKGNDYPKLHDFVRKNVKTIVAIGESAEKVYQEFHSLTRCVKASSMDDAVKLATQIAISGDVVLLSPACASFDWFNNYEHRGEVFKQLVNAL